jgi:hypothetical protein
MLFLQPFALIPERPRIARDEAQFIVERLT